MLFLSKKILNTALLGADYITCTSLEMADGQPPTWLLCVAAAVEIRLLETVIHESFFLLKLIYYIFPSLEI